MTNADRQLLSAIKNGPYDPQVTKLAAVVESLCRRVDALEQQANALLEQQGFETRKLHKMADSLASIAYETGVSKPKPFQDFLPEGPEHFHTADSQACYGNDCFTAVAEDPDTCPRCGGLDGTHTARSCEAPSAQRFPSAEELREFAGRWVAVKAGKVIHCAGTLTEILEFLRVNNIFADSSFHVPAFDEEIRELVAAASSVDAEQAEVLHKVLSRSVTCAHGCHNGNNDFDCPVHGGMRGVTS